MEFAEKLSALAAKVRQQRDIIQTEEATKNAFVMPFISTILGYDVFNSLEVPKRPERHTSAPRLT